jgi:hypothetical protein
VVSWPALWLVLRASLAEGQNRTVQRWLATVVRLCAQVRAHLAALMQVDQAGKMIAERVQAAHVLLMRRTAPLWTLLAQVHLLRASAVPVPQMLLAASHWPARLCPLPAAQRHWMHEV